MGKEIIWIGGSKEELSVMPQFIKSSFGGRLREIQSGIDPADMKPLPQLGHGICELRESFDTNAYRLMYVAKLKKGIYVLDVFVKKSKTGIGLPRQDVERIKMRFKKALKQDGET